jgi:hypothetical protein
VTKHEVITRPFCVTLAQLISHESTINPTSCPHQQARLIAVFHFSRLSAITIPILQTHSNIIVVLRWCLRSRQLQALLRREEDRSLIRLTHSYSAQLIGEFSFLLLPARKTTVPKTVLSRRSMTSVVTLLSLL